MRDTLIAGDTLDFATSVPDFPATDGWTLKFRLIPQTAGVGSPIELTAAPYQNQDYRVQVGPQATAAWVPGDYTLSRWVEKSGARYAVETSPELPVQVRILADPAAATVFDGRTDARRNLEAIEAFLGGKATAAVKEYEINGRRLVNFDPPQLISMADYYRRQVANEDRAAALAAGLGNPRHLYVRFGRS